KNDRVLHSQIAIVGVLGHLGTSADHGTAVCHVFRPRHQQRREHEADMALESAQVFAFDQFIAELTETKACVEVAIAPCSDVPQLFQDLARGIVDATLYNQTY